MQRFETAMSKAAVLMEALPYIQDFKGSVVLLKLGGSVMEVEENLDSLMGDIALMNAVGIKVVIVHGGGKAISRAIKERSEEHTSDSSHIAVSRMPSSAWIGRAHV